MDELQEKAVDELLDLYKQIEYMKGYNAALAEHWNYRLLVKGEWAFDPLGGDWICSICDNHSMEHGGFCPNCGADMRDGGEHE